jgi:hypothetical protein
MGMYGVSKFKNSFYLYNIADEKMQPLTDFDQIQNFQISRYGGFSPDKNFVFVNHEDEMLVLNRSDFKIVDRRKRSDAALQKYFYVSAGGLRRSLDKHSVVTRDNDNNLIYTTYRFSEDDYLVIDNKGSVDGSAKGKQRCCPILLSLPPF